MAAEKVGACCLNNEAIGSLSVCTAQRDKPQAYEGAPKTRRVLDVRDFKIIFTAPSADQMSRLQAWEESSWSLLALKFYVWTFLRKCRTISRSKKVFILICEMFDTHFPIFCINGETSSKQNLKQDLFEYEIGFKTFS